MIRDKAGSTVPEHIPAAVYCGTSAAKHCGLLRPSLASDNSLNERYLNALLDGRPRWLPTVQWLRPDLPWALVLRQIRAITPPVRSFTERTLVKACKTLVKDGYADASMLEPAKRLPPDTRVAPLVADRLRTHPDSTLASPQGLYAIQRFHGHNGNDDKLSRLVTSD